MKVLDARINWYEGWSNDPELQVLVDRIPKLEELVFDVKQVDESHALCFAEQDGYVAFYCDDAKDHHGYGGWTFEIRLKDGTTRTLRGPWSSSPSVMNDFGFTPSWDAAMTADREDWDRGYTYCAGHITMELVRQAVKQFCPGVTIEMRKKSYSDSLYPLYKRCENPCSVCKGAGEFTWAGKHQSCARCKGTGLGDKDDT